MSPVDFFSICYNASGLYPNEILTKHFCRFEVGPFAGKLEGVSRSDSINIGGNSLTTRNRDQSGMTAWVHVDGVEVGAGASLGTRLQAWWLSEPDETVQMKLRLYGNDDAPAWPKLLSLNWSLPHRVTYTKTEDEAITAMSNILAAEIDKEILNKLKTMTFSRDLNRVLFPNEKGEPPKKPAFPKLNK